ncbi:MAG TPA: MDR family oxidoreductase [Ilumatobacteraceae bacterium]|nr:MDR family oxidoreductase [Ilumatobacteraceae bacterium]
MSDTFTALVLRETDAGPVGALEQLTDADLPEGDVTIDVDYSSLNYKDAMALVGQGRIVRSYPMVPGIDLAGTVVASDSPDFSVGDAVISTGWGVGERFWGGYTQRQRVRSEWLVKRPDAMSSLTAMAIGTAGLTAMLCVMAIEDAHVLPAAGPVVVTGAAGGVGSVAVALLAALGFEVTAVTGRPETEEYLAGLGAIAFLTREEMTEPARPLESEQWAAAVDTVGSKMLAKVLAQMEYGGVVAACGLAGGVDLPTTVMPFILRNVRLQGVESVMAPTPLRKRAWARLLRDLPADMIVSMTEIIALSDLLDRGPSILAGQVRGRWVVDPSR